MDTVGSDRCTLCERENFCLELSIGYDLIGPCPTCGAATDFSVDGPFDRCVSCDGVCRLTELVEGRPACLVCLREGRFAITKDTELGMVRWRDAREGLTHCSEPTRMDADALMSLVLTPDFLTIQGSVWKFHCERPMTFVGRWGKRDFEQNASDGEGAASASRIADVPEVMYAELEDTARDEDFWVGAYVFRCPVCGTVAGNWDMA